MLSELIAIALCVCLQTDNKPQSLTITNLELLPLIGVCVSNCLAFINRNAKQLLFPVFLKQLFC